MGMLKKTELNLKEPSHIEMSKVFGLNFIVYFSDLIIRFIENRTGMHMNEKLLSLLLSLRQDHLQLNHT